MKSDSVGVTTNTLHPAEVLTKGCERTAGGRGDKGEGGRLGGWGGGDGQENKGFQ